jgi:hypothetical protein
MVTKSISLLLIFSLLLWTAAGCISTYPLAQGEQAMLQTEPGEAIDAEMIVHTADGSSFKFSPNKGRLTLKGATKAIVGQGSKNGSGTTEVEIPLVQVKSIQIDDHVYVYTKDSLRYEFTPLAWACTVEGGAVQSIRGSGTVSHIGSHDAVMVLKKEIPIEQISNIEMERISTGKSTLIILGIAVLGGIIALLIPSSPRGGSSTGGGGF